MPGRFFSVTEHGEVILQSDIRGESVVFPSVEEFNRIAQTTFPYTEFLHYEPPRFLITEFAGHSNMNQPSVISMLEGHLNNIAVYKTRLEDPLFGLTGQELDDAQARLAAIEAYNSQVAEIEAEQDAAGIKQYTPEQVRTYISNQVAGITDLASAKTVMENLFTKLAMFVLKPNPPDA